MEGGAKSGYTHARHVHVLDAIMPPSPSSSSTPFSSIGILAFRLDAPRQNCLVPRNDTAAQLVLRCVPRVKQNSLCEAKRRIDSLSTFRRSSKIPPPSSSFHILFFSIRIDSTISSVEEDRKGVEGRVALPIIPLFCPVQVAAT